MKAVLSMFWQICLLRRGPEYMPTQGWFVASITIANIVCTTTFAMQADEASLPRALTVIVVGQSATAALVWLALTLREFGNRFLATITAMFGCDLILTALLGALLQLTGAVTDSVAPAGFLVFMVWSMAVAGFVLHRALNTSLMLGILVAFGISLISFAASQTAVGAA